MLLQYIHVHTVYWLFAYGNISLAETVNDDIIVITTSSCDVWEEICTDNIYRYETIKR